MEDLAEQVQAVLSDPDQMARVMELAGRLGFGPEPGSQDAVTGSEQPPAGQAGPSPAPPPGGRTSAVLRSLGPLLSTQKQPKLERAIRAAALAKIVRGYLSALGQEGPHV